MFHLSVLLSGVMILLAFLICGIVCYQLRTKKITAWSTSTLPRKRRPVESSWNGSARYTNGSNNNGSRRKESNTFRGEKIRLSSSLGFLSNHFRI